MKWGSSKTTGEIMWPLELTETIRAPLAAESALCRPTVRVKWPRKFVANCISQPSGVRSNAGNAMMPALLIRTSKGPLHPATNALTELLIGQIEMANRDIRVARRGADLSGDLLAGVHPADSHDYLGTDAGERAARLSTDAGCASRYKDALTAQLDAADDLFRSRLEAKGCLDAAQDRTLLEVMVSAMRGFPCPAMRPGGILHNSATVRFPPKPSIREDSNQPRLDGQAARNP